MRRSWIPIAIFAAVLTVAVGVGLWRAGVFAEGLPDVPSCDDLANAMPERTAGTWTVRRTVPPRTLTTSTASCEFAFSSADQRFHGEISVDMWGHTDAEALRDDVESFPCYGATATTPQADVAYLASRHCQEVIGDRTRVGMSAATDHRFAHVLVAITGPTAAADETANTAHDIARSTAKQALHLAAST
ncbi:hypothetical protein WEI85_21080 [Actinomycetes bacterium KLBMP 9797]